MAPATWKDQEVALQSSYGTRSHVPFTYTAMAMHWTYIAAGDAIKNCKYIKDALDVAFEVSKLVKFSPKRTAELEKLKEELALDSPGVHDLCPTRWAVRAASLKSMLSNYAALQQLWELAQDSTSDPTIKSQIIGVESQFKKFSFFFGVHLAYLVLRHTDNLSKTLQCLHLKEHTLLPWLLQHFNSPLWWPVFCLLGSYH